MQQDLFSGTEPVVNQPKKNTEKFGADFSPCGKHRYRLWSGDPIAMYIGLNPSTADQTQNDPTIRRIISFSQNFGFGGFYMMNLFSFITPKPAELRPFAIRNEKNIARLSETALKCSKIVFCWGNFDVFGIDKEIQALFPDALCFGKNANGSPKHPLYLAKNTNLLKF